MKVKLTTDKALADALARFCAYGMNFAKGQNVLMRAQIETDLSAVYNRAMKIYEKAAKPLPITKKPKANHRSYTMHLSANELVSLYTVQEVTTGNGHMPRETLLIGDNVLKPAVAAIMK